MPNVLPSPVAGLEVTEATAGWPGTNAYVVEGPDFAALNRMGTQQPVHHAPAEFLRGAAPAPTDGVAHVLATLAGYSYADAPTLSIMATRLGLERNRVRMISQSVDAMFIRSTAFVVQSECGRVAVLSYRGTEPTNLVNWLTDGDVDPETIGWPPENRQDDDIHAGFYRNVRATRFDVIATLLDALEGRPVSGGDATLAPLEALYITGHSLGGGMAMIMAALLERDALADPDGPARQLLDRLRGVYTFGAPMVGTSSFARRFPRTPELGALLRRYVYRNDVVPALPPALTGAFEHVGQQYGLGKRGWEACASSGQANPLDLALAPLGFLFRQVALLRDVALVYSMHAHSPQHYIASLTPPGATEFGRPSVGTPPPR